MSNPDNEDDEWCTKGGFVVGPIVPREETSPTTETDILKIHRRMADRES